MKNQQKQPTFAKSFIPQGKLVFRILEILNNFLALNAVQMAPESRRRYCLLSNITLVALTSISIFTARGVASRVYEYVALPLEMLDVT